MGRLRLWALGVVLAVSTPALAQTETSSLAAGYRDLMLDWKGRAVSCRAELEGCRREVEAIEDFSLDARQGALEPVPAPRPEPVVPPAFWIGGTAAVILMGIVGGVVGFYVGRR